MQDSKQRFVFDQADVRGCYARLDATCQQIQATHHYPAVLATWLNEFAVAAVLLQDSIKLPASLTIQLRCQGLIDLMMADCSAEGQVRAVCEYDQTHVFSAPLTLNSLPGAVLAVTITPHEGERYQSVIPVEYASLSACLEDYFARSEQLPSQFRLLADARTAVGISLHALPAQQISDAEQAHAYFEHLTVLLQSYQLEEALVETAEQALTKLYHDEQCRLFAAKAIEFGCECSLHKSRQALMALGRDEVEHLIEQQQADGERDIVIDCHFCFQRYRFSFTESRALFTETLQ